ncbi:MAG: hypothetical protein E7564_10800 [Ruminococcaceae bacterium]|nr:hypothetical protein [Oscillospiraceae bacterium]
MEENVKIDARDASTIEHKISKPKRGFRYSYYFKAFSVAFLLASIIFLPFIIRDGGRFIFYGDFNAQQIPFYKLAHEAVTNGNMGWSHTTDLGANFVGSYSFYLLGSPFFWITVFFPTEFIQYLMGPLLILKIACAATTGYLYIHRYIKNQDYAVLGGILYAFSGFSVYNIFFNHFHEAIVFFPIMLWALDEYMYHKRRGVFAFSVFLCCTVNYYFFVGQVTFLIVYFVIRMISYSWTLKLKDFFSLALESVCGVGMSCFLLIPSIMAVLQNWRVNDPIYGWNALMYGNEQRYLHILQSMFFPPDHAARPNFTPDSNSKWASLGAWLPLFGMTGVIGYLQVKRKSWLKKLIWTLFLMALIPVLNASFQLFNSSYYARWFYMLTLITSLATIMSLEDQRVDWHRSIKWCAAITLGIAIPIGLMPKTLDGEKTTLTIGLEAYPTRFWTNVAVAVLSLALLAVIFACLRKNKKLFKKILNTGVYIAIVVYSVFFLIVGKMQSQEPYEFYIPYALNGGEDVKLENLDSVRSDFYDTQDNMGMHWGIPSIQTFHSIVPGSVMEFYDSIGVQRDVASRPDTSHYGLRAITSTRWLFDEEGDDKYFAGENYDKPEMPGWIYYGNANGFDIWENEYYIPMGFSYDKYLTKSDFETISEAKHELAMLRGVVIEDEDEEFFSEFMTTFNPHTVRLDEDTYEKDCIQRAKMSCTDFEYTQTGFTATFSSEKTRVVFFSVPYESGWTATINGESADIYKVNVGFMGVIVPRGTDIKITFTYSTPGLVSGILVSLLSIMVIGIYLLMFKLKEKPVKKALKKAKKRPLGNFSDYAKSKGASFKNRVHGKYLKTKPLPFEDEDTDVDISADFVSETIDNEDIYELYEQDGKAEENSESEK